jgi:hypothetical protein
MAGKKSPGQTYTEESFGHKIPQPSLSKGSIEIFGDLVHDGQKLGGKATGPNSKTGYPGDQK